MLKFKEEQQNRYLHKKCKCPKDCWEIIIVDHDENFNDEATIYYHCVYCGTDWLITDYYDESKIFYSHEL